jgi:rhomboid protease GluP
MNIQFRNLLIKTMIESKSYMPLRNEEGKLMINDNISILTKNSSGTQIYIELISGDNFTSDEIAERLQRNCNMLSGLKAKGTHYFFEIFVFKTEPEETKINAITSNQLQETIDRKYLKCISIDLSKSETKKHFKSPTSDMGLTKIIKQVFANGGKTEVEPQEIEDLVRKKEKEYEIEFKVKVPVFTYILIAINLLVFGLLTLYSMNSGISYDKLLIDFGAKENSLIIGGQYFRFFTAMFLHANLTHVAVNCYSLYAVGVSVERIFGRFKFLSVFLIAGVLGNVASFMFSTSPGVGASGAIFGLLGALLYFGIQRPTLFKVYFGYNIIIIIVINLVYGFSTTGIDNFAHLGGLVGGFLASGVFLRSEKEQWYLNRYLYICLTLLLTVAGIFYGFNNNQNKIYSYANELDKYTNAKDWRNVELKAEEILALNPSDASLKISVLYELARAESINGENSKAIENAKILTTLDPGNGHYILGVLYFNEKEYKLSKSELLSAKAAGNNNAQIDQLLSEIK